MTTRREFVKALAVTAAVAAIPALASGATPEPLPVLYADGVHDDAPAIQALLDGRDALDARSGEILRGNEWAVVDRKMVWCSTILAPIEGSEHDHEYYNIRFDEPPKPQPKPRGRLENCDIDCRGIVDGPAMLGYYAGDADGIERAWQRYRRGRAYGYSSPSP